MSKHMMATSAAACSANFLLFDLVVDMTRRSRQCDCGLPETAGVSLVLNCDYRLEQLCLLSLKVYMESVNTK